MDGRDISVFYLGEDYWAVGFLARAFLPAEDMLSVRWIWRRLKYLAVIRSFLLRTRTHAQSPTHSIVEHKHHKMCEIERVYSNHALWANSIAPVFWLILLIHFIYMENKQSYVIQNYLNLIT